MGPFEVWKFENKIALYLGQNRYAVMDLDTFEDWAQGWLEKVDEHHGRNLGTGRGESSCSESATRKE